MLRVISKSALNQVQLYFYQQLCVCVQLCWKLWWRFIKYPHLKPKCECVLWFPCSWQQTDTINTNHGRKVQSSRALSSVLYLHIQMFLCPQNLTMKANTPIWKADTLTAHLTNDLRMDSLCQNNVNKWLITVDFC